MASFNWTCPHCDRDQTVTDAKQDVVHGSFHTGGSRDGQLGIHSRAITCANSTCSKTTVTVWLGEFINNPARQLVANFNATPLFSRRIVPEGSAKSFPDYVPEAIRNDYVEACLIRDLSPKASATLARRCLQGMVRHFGQVKPGTLFSEISALESAVLDGTAPRGVSEDSISALNAVRKVGNIGAHMEADVDVIVDVEGNEAQVLIELIESLIEDWYIETNKRRVRFASAVALAETKAVQLSQAKAKALPSPTQVP